jgi:hypothetical protein
MLLPSHIFFKVGVQMFSKFSPVSSLWKSFERARLCEYCLNEPDLLALMASLRCELSKVCIGDFDVAEIEGQIVLV